MEQDSGYIKHHHGSLIVVGSAPCVFEDLRHAHQMRPDAMVCLVNEAGAVIQGDFLATCHAEQMPLFKRIYVEAWGDTDGITFHSALPSRPNRMTPEVDHYWQGLRTGAGSGFFAVRLGLALRFEEIILAGCPMYGGDGYYNSETTAPDCDRYQRMGYRPHDDDVIRGYRAAINRMIHAGELDQVFSMSGFTKHRLGMPPHVPAYLQEQAS